MDLDINQYLDLFVEESKEHLQDMNDILLDLEQDTENEELLNEIFRISHTLKGMAGTMGYNNMANLTHDMEDVLQAIRSGEIGINTEIVDILFECLDALELSVDYVSQHGEEDENDHSKLIEKLKKLFNEGEQASSEKQTLETIGKYDEYVINALKRAKAQGLNSYKINIKLNSDCMLKAARAFIVFDTLEEFSEIIYSNPSVEDIEDEKFDLEFSLVIITKYAQDKIKEEILKISEIEEVNVESIKIKESEGQTSEVINKYDEYVINALKRAKMQGLNSYEINIKLNSDCMLKAARAFIVFDTMEGFSEIIYSNPSVEDIEDEKFDLEFSLVTITKYTQDKIKEEILKISEIEKINIKSIKIEESKEQVNKKEKAKKESKKAKKSKKKPSKAIKTSRVGKTVRVDIDRLDTLMNLVSELIIIKTRMEDMSVTTSKEDMNEAIEYLERITTNLHDSVMKVRMVPIERVFNRFPRMVRDLSKELDKKINLEMSGEETEVDRTVIDEIGDPLIHLIRNSIDHGIEHPDERVEAGKDKTGTVKLKAYPDGNNVVIEVEDDGKGINHEQIKRKAIEKQIIDEKDAEDLTKDESVGLLFKAGFSTSEVVSDVSGRGVGLDVVKSKIEAINGSIEVKTCEGEGTKFIIRIPLTLAIIQALLVKLGEEIYAIPLSSISEITSIEYDRIRKVQGQEIILYRDKTLPMVRLNYLMGIEESEMDELTVVIVRKGDKQAGLIVDDLIGQQEIVIKPLGKFLSNIKYLAGATILGNGKISLILDVNSLF